MLDFTGVKMVDDEKKGIAANKDDLSQFIDMAGKKSDEIEPVSKDDSIETKCEKCGYEWEYTGNLARATCPSCGQKVWAKKESPKQQENDFEKAEEYEITESITPVIDNNMKGYLGEKFVIIELTELDIVSPISVIWELFEDEDYRKSIVTELEDEEEPYEAVSIKKFGARSKGLPDFYVRGTNICIEVKTGEYARLENSQKREFPKILDKGYRIFLIKVKISIEKDTQYVTKYITKYDCYELLRCKDHKYGMKRKKINLKK